MESLNPSFFDLRISFLHLLISPLLMLSEVCRDVAVEPMLTPLTGEHIISKTTKIDDQLRLDFGEQEAFG